MSSPQRWLLIRLVWTCFALSMLWMADGRSSNAAPATSAASKKTDSSNEAATAKLSRPIPVPNADPALGLSNPVDLLLNKQLEGKGLDWKNTVSDARFARRVSLDLIGLLPDPIALDAFAADRAEDKRLRLVRQLLSQREDYAVHWLAFWNDLLRNEYRGTGFIDDGRRQITEWLFRSLYENKAYDRFVRELVSAAPGADGFLHGIEWRGVVNASQSREMQAAQTTAQVFLGINLKCASCHNSFVSQWTLADSYGLAATFAEGPLEIYRCDKPTGEKSYARFLFPEMGTIDPTLPRQARLDRLASLLTAAADKRLPRTLVNRYWARLMGRGLVEPLDNMELESWAPDLLEWLATDLVQHHYDIKHTLEVICTSRAYQLPSVGEKRQQELSITFQGPIVRRMTAEQFLDAVFTVTGAWPKPGRELLKKDGRGQGGQLGAARSVIAKAVGPSPPIIKVRAALAMDDPLARALGRPNREQVVTRRDSLASMLQALELANGITLDSLLRKGGSNWTAREKNAANGIVRQVYRIALGRGPTESEIHIAAGLIGELATVDGVQDFLWLIVMLPEFELIE